MSNPLTYAELFAGAGGMSIGLEAAGWHCVGHAEIEPHARAVLRHRWPDVPLYGDVSQLDGSIFKGITMLTGGSPCQDLSIAGKRKGMTEGSGTRSSLFHEQMRIWRESEAPLVLWENVVGAYSSNNGRDFASVLSSIVGGPVAVPADGWRSAGVASGPAGVAAWRTLDLQHFGWDGNTTPQRRRRIFVLGARTGTYDPAELLLVADGLLGHLASSGETREGVAADAGRSVEGASRHVAVNISNAVASLDPVMGTLDTDGASTTAIGAQTRGVVLTYDARGNGDGQTVNTLAGDHQNRVTDYTAIVIDKNTAHVEMAGLVPTIKTDQAHHMGAVILRNREGKPGGGKGPLVSAERSLTLGTANDQVVFTQPILAPTISVGAHNAAPGLNGQDQVAYAEALHRSGVGIPRRLMPVETERLMGWPSGWTSTGIDEQGRTYQLKDTPRYRLCGNGIGAPVAAWIGMRIRDGISGA